MSPVACNSQFKLSSAPRICDIEYCILSIKFDYESQKSMKVLLDIKDSKADFVMELLENLAFVKVEPISKTKALFLKEFKQAVAEVNLATQGKVKLKTAEQLLDEL